MAGIFDLIKGLNTGISQGVGAVASAPQKALQATSTPQAKQVIANLTQIALDKKRKEEEAKAKVQALINAQTKNVSTAPLRSIDESTMTPANMTTGARMTEEEIKASQREKDLNMIKGQNNPNNPLDNLVNTLLKTQLANRVAVGPIANFMRERQASTEKIASRPATSFMDRVGDFAKGAGDVASLGFNALPPVAAYNAMTGLGDMSGVTRPLVKASDAVAQGFAGVVNAIPQAGLNALPLSDSVKKDLSTPLSVITNLLALKAGSKIGEKAQVRINDAGYRAELMNSMNKSIARDGATFNSGPNFSPIIKALVDAEKKLTKNTVVQALDPTGLTSGAAMNVDTVNVKRQDPLIEEAKKYKSVEEFVSAQVDGYHGTPNKEFSEFKLGVGNNSENETNGLGVWVTNSPEAAKTFSNKIEGGLYGGSSLTDVGGTVMSVKVNLKNPKVYNSTQGMESILTEIENLEKQKPSLTSVQRENDPNIRWGIIDKRKSIEKEIDKLKKEYKRDAFEHFMDDRDQFANYISKGAKWEDQYIALGIPETNKQFVNYLKEQGHDGIIIKGTEYDASSTSEGKIDQIVAFDPKDVLTKQQLTDIYNKAHSETVKTESKASVGMEDGKAGLPEPVYAGNVKMKNIGSSDDARALINLGAQRLKAEGGDGYKEVVSLDQVKQETKDLSERTGINKETLERWAKESVENRVRITAAREAMSSYAEQVASLSMKSRNEPTNMALKQELADKVRSMQEIQAATSTIIAESGRTLGANRIKTLQGDALLIQKYIKDNQGKDPSGIADFLGSVSPKDLPDAIKKLTMPSWLDRIMTVRQASLLTDPRTTERNLLGNTLGVGLRTAQKPFDIIADKIISGFNKTESTRSFSELLPGNKYKKMLAKKEIDQYLEKYANESGKFDNTALKKTFIEKGADKVFQFLEFQDKIFKRMIAKDSIVSSARSQAAKEKLTGKAYKLRMEELVKNPTNDMLRSMANEAIKWTYQNKPNSRVYDTVAGIRNKIPVVGKLAVPFLRTVWNLGSMAIERTVPGQALNLYKLTQGKISGKQALSSLLLTAAIQGAVSAAVESGNVTGTERDPKKRAIREAEGIKDDVVNTPFGSFSYKNLEPVSSIIGTAVDVHKTAKNVFSGEKGVVSGAGSVGFSMADRFVNNSFLRGIKDLLDLAPGYQDFSGRNAEERSVNNLGDYGKQQLATFYPRAFNWLEEISNEARSQRPEGFLENIMASTPGLSKGVATKVDIWGKDIKKQDVTGNSAINTVLAALVPIQIEKQRNDPVNKEILRLKYYPSVPTQTIDGVSLSNKEYETYAREAGTMAKARLDMLIKDPIYQRKSDADKIRAIESTIADSRKEAKKSLGNLLDAGQRENLKGKNAKEVEDAAKKVFKETLTPAPKQKTVSQIKSGAKTAATTAAKGAQKVQSINNMIDVISEQLPQRTEQEILGILTTKTGGKFSEEEILFAIDMAKAGQKMSTTNPQDATQEYLQKNVIK